MRIIEVADGDREMKMATRKEKIEALLARGGRGGEPLAGLKNDARYCALRCICGDYSAEVLSHLERCSQIQRAGRNHT
jgi:hypothetical protein